MDGFQIRSGIVALYAEEGYTYLRLFDATIEWNNMGENKLSIRWDRPHGAYSFMIRGLMVTWGDFHHPVLGFSVRVGSRFQEFRICPLEWPVLTFKLSE